MKHALAAILSALLLGGCAGTAASPSPTATSASPSSSQPTPSATSTSLLPATFTNGWVPEASLADNVNSIVHSLNEVFPDADLEGAAYRDPDDAAYDKGVLILVVGKIRVEAAALLDVFAEGATPKQLREHTICAEKGKGESRKLGCVTDTAPSVSLYYTTATHSVFTAEQLAAAAASFQADLPSTGDQPTDEPTDQATDEPGTFTPHKADFKIGIKILKKKCFGDFGCNITYRIKPNYVGDQDLPDTGTIEITYRVSGGESGPEDNTFTIESGSASYDKEEFTSTSSSARKLIAKVIDVSYTE